MNKLKRKKQLNIIFVVFVLTFFVGTAFAFVSDGPLEFSGTSNVAASLRMDVVRAVPTGTYLYAGTDHGVGDTTSRSQPHGVKNVRHEVSFSDKPGQHVYWRFTIRNNGTMPAEITEVVHTWDPSDDFTFEVISDLARNTPILPGDERDLVVKVQWNHVEPLVSDAWFFDPWNYDPWNVQVDPWNPVYGNHVWYSNQAGEQYAHFEFDTVIHYAMSLN